MGTASQEAEWKIRVENFLRGNIKHRDSVWAKSTRFSLNTDEHDQIRGVGMKSFMSFQGWEFLIDWLSRIPAETGTPWAKDRAPGEVQKRAQRSQSKVGSRRESLSLLGCLLSYVAHKAAVKITQCGAIDGKEEAGFQLLGLGDLLWLLSSSTVLCNHS